MKSWMSAMLLFQACLFLNTSKAQAKAPTSEAVQIVSDYWKKDTGSCLGYRFKLKEKLLDSKPDSITADQLFHQLGKPGLIIRFNGGSPRKDYVTYYYYIYKDECPKIYFEALALGFVYDEIEKTLTEITTQLFCK